MMGLARCGGRRFAEYVKSSKSAAPSSRRRSISLDDHARGFAFSRVVGEQGRYRVERAVLQLELRPHVRGTLRPALPSVEAIMISKDIAMLEGKSSGDQCATSASNARRAAGRNLEDLRVDHRGADIAVTEKLLHRANVSPG